MDNPTYSGPVIYLGLLSGGNLHFIVHTQELILLLMNVFPFIAVSFRCNYNLSNDNFLRVIPTMEGGGIYSWKDKVAPVLN
jgi:hypothetical protein